MKTRIALSIALALLVVCSGCSMLSQSGGTIGAVQTLDDQIAAKYGVPQSVVDTVRKTLGILDTRTFPDSSRVLPAGYSWKRDILDASNKVVSVETLHWGTPYVITAGPVSSSGVAPGDLLADPVDSSDPTAQLIGIINMLKAYPGLLEPAE